MSYSSADYSNANTQRTYNSYIGSTNTKDFDPSYIDRQKNILTQQKQAELGKIPTGIKRTSHSDPIQSTLYGFNNQEVDLGVNDTSFDKYHKYNPNYDNLNKRGLLNENFKYRLNTFQINIDSSKRNVNPIVSYDKEITLPTDPLSFNSLTTQVGIGKFGKSTSNLLEIKCPNHNFLKGDRFSLGGITNNPISINTIYTDINNASISAVTFTPGSTSVSFSCIYRIITPDGSNVVTFDPHFKVGTGINYSTLKAYDTSDLKVKISGFTTSPLGVPSVGNIPINFLNGTHQVYFINPDPKGLATNPVNIPDNSNPQQVRINGFYILLNTAYSDAPPITPYTLTLQFNHYGGIPLNQLNAEFPTDASHTFGYHEVFSTTSDTIVTKINNVAYYTDNINGTNVQASFGGDEVYISKITNLIYGYNDPNSYIVNLPRALHNVISVKLVSTTFPNTSKIIRNTPGNNNNMLYWQNQDDGDVTYQIALDAGNYSPDTLKTAIEQKVYTVQRKYITASTTTTNYTNANFMNVTIDTDTNIVTFKSYKEAKLSQPIIGIDPPILDTGQGSSSYSLTIQQTSHGLKVGDSVLFSGFITHKGIPDTVLNTTHIVTGVASTDTYTISIDNFNLYYGTRSETGGGFAARAYVPNNFRLLFNSSDTFGTLLGFRNVGDDTSITKFGDTLNNSDAYDDEVVVTDVITGSNYVYNKSGNKSLLTSNNIKLSGYDYILMSVNELNATINLGTNFVPKYFAKINLAGLPGKILYDTFVQTASNTYDPIDIDKLTIHFFAPDGSLYDFNGVDHSFVLEIMVENNIILESGIVSNHTIF
jgi:hypothetical protein